MRVVSVREFSYNPSAIFSRVEQGETIEVSRHGKVIAVLYPGPAASRRYSDLVAKGIVRLKGTTTADLQRTPRYDIPDDVSPLDLLLEDRAEDDR
jgi:antitoxin (DNA-binding transcriptional repressor) of toxin-antitoxin stability system